MKYHFQIHEDPDGLWAECIELKGCITQSSKDTMDDLFEMMEEALNLYLDEPDPKIIFPLPDDTCKGSKIVEVHVQPKIAFALLLRHERKSKHLTQAEMAHKLGYSNIWSYQLLESPKKANPELTTLSKIKNVFSDFNLNLIF